jgi:hypothetical protein
MVAAPVVPGQVTNVFNMLQAQDGSFVGTVGVGDPNSPQNKMVAFDASGNVRWAAPDDQPRIATDDGGVIGQSGITYDQNGNATGQGAIPGQYSWTGSWYGLSTSSAVQAAAFPIVDVADSFAAFQGGNVNGGGTANRPAVKTVQQLIAQIASSYVGSQNWLDTPGHNQRNLFVKDVLKSAGLNPPISPVNPSWGHRIAYLLGMVDTPGYPAQSRDWANPSTDLKCWRPVTVPVSPLLPPGTLPPDVSRPGDVIAEAINYSDAYGHVGIIVGSQQTVSADSAATCIPPYAAAGTIDISDYGFRLDNWGDPYACRTHGLKSKASVKRFVCQ